jgi:hypothetical protein
MKEYFQHQTPNAKQKMRMSINRKYAQLLKPLKRNKHHQPQKHLTPY